METVRVMGKKKGSPGGREVQRKRKDVAGMDCLRESSKLFRATPASNLKGKKEKDAQDRRGMSVMLPQDATKAGHKPL